MATSNVNEFEQDFEVANAGAASTYPVQAGAIKQGGFAMLGGHPCKVVNIARSKPGKHGHAKVVLTGIDIFTGKKHDDGVRYSSHSDVFALSPTPLHRLNMHTLSIASLPCCMY